MTGMTASTSRRSFVKGATAAGLSLAAALNASANAAMADTALGVNALPEAWDVETDVVVMGYGYAGEASAISAAAAGALVQVFEKAPEEHAGGNSSVCCGAIQLANGDGAVEYWKAIAWDGAPDEECQAMADNCAKMPQWFNDNVFEITIGENTEEDKRTKTFNGVKYPESNVITMSIPVESSVPSGGKGNAYWKALDEVIHERYADSITVNYGAPVTHLIFDPVTKEVFGVRAEIDGVEKTVKARKGVIMACGGFENNYEMVQDFVQQHYEQFHIGSPYNTGDGIIMLMEIGAKLRHMAAVEYGSPCQYELSKQYHQAIPAFNAGDVTHMIHINNHGERFYPESARWPAHDKRYPVPCFIQESPSLETKNYPWWMVYDETRRGLGTLFAWSNPVRNEGWAAVHNVYQWSDDNLAEVDAGLVLKADTIEELGQKMGFSDEDLATFISTVERYNEYGAQGEDPDFGRTPTKAEQGEDGVGMTLSDGPFYATRVCLCYLNTNGGGDRTVDYQIKDWKGNPIPRLYEAGEFGSLFYHYYAGGGNVCEAFTNGMMAGQNAAALEPWA